MIEIGIKCSLDDFDSKKHCDGVDFFEVIHGTHLDSRFARVSSEIMNMGKDFFVHLPSEFPGKDGLRTLLNIASANSVVRARSREIIERVIQTTHPHHPAGWILHAPTKQNFSTERRLFDKNTNEELEAGLDWINRLDGNILIENVPDAILWDSQVYMTEPCSLEQLAARNAPLVVDLAHLYTAKPNPKEFIDAVRILLSNVLYVHVATLTKKVPHDAHGSVFTATEPEYPSMELIDEVLKMISDFSQSVSRTIRLVCEPRGDTEVHLHNFQILKDRIEKLRQIQR